MKKDKVNNEIKEKTNKKEKSKKSFSKFMKKVWFSICGFFVRTYHEMRRMRWPSKKVLKSATYIVLSFVFLFGLYIVLGDLVIAQLFKYIY